MFSDGRMFMLNNALEKMLAHVADCITQVTFKFVNNTLLSNQRGLQFTNYL